jgi:hypothetical protein
MFPSSKCYLFLNVLKILGLVLGENKKWIRDSLCFQYRIKPIRSDQRCSLSKLMSCKVLLSPTVDRSELSLDGRGTRRRCWTQQEIVVQTDWNRLHVTKHSFVHNKCIQKVFYPFFTWVLVLY